MRIVTFFIVIFTLVSCSQNGRRPADKVEMKEIPSQNEGSVKPDQRKSTAKKDVSNEWKWEDCVRSIPEPVCKKNAFKNHSFRLDSTSGPTYIGNEQFTTKYGDVIRIKNCGCEYYTLQFEILTRRFSGEPNDLVYWNDVLIQILKTFDKNLEGGITISDGYDVLREYYNNAESPALGVQQTYGESEIGHFVTFDKIVMMEKTKYELGVTFSVGPL